MIIGICGIGIVGNAIKVFFENLNIKLVLYDKYKKEFKSDFYKILESDLIFLALPTLYSSVTKKYDINELINTCEKLSKNNYNGIVVIKSTVLPGTTNNILEKFKNLKIVHNPEFLSARTSVDDFKNQNQIVIGIPDDLDIYQFNLLTDLYKKHFPNSYISISSSTESEIMKISVNNFYATKIQFFNEIYFLSKKTNTDYKKIRDMMLKNQWINPMHTMVPGTDGKFSYGGACFPKDTNALNEFLKENNLPNKVISGTVNEQKEIREKNENDIIKDNINLKLL